jgi:hypothetical protein
MRLCCSCRPTSGQSFWHIASSSALRRNSVRAAFESAGYGVSTTSKLSMIPGGSEIRLQAVSNHLGIGGVWSSAVADPLHCHVLVPDAPIAPPYSSVFWSSMPVSLTTMRDLNESMNNVSLNAPTTAAIVIAAAVLLILAQSFINKMLKGDQGLGAFLSDGSGYQKSAFQPKRKENDAPDQDPLPWLKLPKLDFVEVAGQSREMAGDNTEEYRQIMQQLEEIRQVMNAEVSAGNIEEAARLQRNLDTIMAKYDIVYQEEYFQ